MISRWLSALACLVVLVAAAPLPAAAATPLSQVAVCATDLQNNLFGIQPWYACLEKDATGNPKITQLSDIFRIIFPLVDSLVKVAVLVAAGYMFYMLFKINVARGDSSKISTAINGLRDAVVGLILAMIAVGLVNFVAGAFIS